MKIRYTTHAERQLAERNLSRKEIERIVRKPQKLIRQGTARHRAIGTIRRHAKRYLLVVIYDRTNAHIEVVTAFLTTKFKKYL